MASTSSMDPSPLDKPSTSASNEIEEAEENTKQIQIPVPEKANSTENAQEENTMQKPVPEKTNSTENALEENTMQTPVPEPVTKSPSQDPNKKKLSPFLKLFESKPKKSKPEKLTKENSPISPEEVKRLEEEAKKQKEEDTQKEIMAISNAIKADLKSIEDASKRINKHKDTVEEAKSKFYEVQRKGADVKDLRELKNVIKALKKKISTQDKDDPKEETELANQLRTISIANAQEENAMQQGKMPNLFTDMDFERTLQFRDFTARYNELPLELKLCLLCFSVFPEDVEIKRRVMVFWWIGEGFVPPRKVRPEETTNQKHWDKFDLMKNNPPEGDITPEHWANFYFTILLKMGFIESAQDKPNPKVDTCKMHPFVRTMLNKIAQKAEFFEFDSDGIVNERFSKSLRACLLNGKIFAENDNKILGNNDKLLENKKSMENIHAIFNVDEAILDSKHDCLSNMRNANVLYLGRWQNLGTHHIEVDDTKILNAKSGSILDGLKNITNLKFLSFQGTSRITELPKSVLKLKNLAILDIRACHNLEKISNDIQCLVNLTHLDMSECYLLDEMPKGISKLKKLQVLSGFVAVESENKKSCTLDDLKEFSYLRKLSIHTGSDKFPLKKDLEALNQFKALSKLTIVWGRATASTERKFSLAKSTTLSKDVAVKVNSVNEQTPNKENQEKKSEEADTGTPLDNDQGAERDNKDGEMKEEILEMVQESQKHDKGKEILKGSTREIATVPEPDIHEASTSSQEVALPPEKDNLKNKGKKQDVSKTNKNKGIKEVLERTPTRRSTSRPSHMALPELPSQLTKLDLQCLPEKQLEWLRPEKLLNLKKLYIRGGRLSDLGQIQDIENDRFDKPKWEQVEALRLKYLDELDMEWIELLELFPKLVYLEKVHCPKLSFFPCDELGIWTKKKSW